ncbi:MAG: hypothetical protein HY319_32265 [Armatimonadetes bacterium]|nr:hypothetical protein [Armatimonadota bacterium]
MRHWWLSALLLLLLGGCSSPSEPEDASAAPTGESKITLKDAQGAELYKLKRKEPGKFKLYRPDDSAVATLKVDQDRVKVEDPGDRELFKIKKKEEGVELEDGAGKRLYRIKLRDEGGLKLEDAGGAEVLKIKAKDDGYEIRRPDGSTLAKVKGRDGQVKFTTEDGKELFVLKGVSDPKAALWMVAEPLDPAARAGLTVFFLEVR